MSRVRSPTPRTPTSDAVGERTRLAWWALRTARAAALVLVVSWVVLGLTWAVAGQDAISDNLLGFLGVVALFGGMLVSLVAFALAIIAGVKQRGAAAEPAASPHPGSPWPSIDVARGG